jgi:hypothetical protein
MHKQTHPKTLRETTKSLKPNKHLQEFYNQEHEEAYDLLDTLQFQLLHPTKLYEGP